MKSFLNSWIVRYFTIFIFVSVILFGAYQILYQPSYEYFRIDGSTSITKINKNTGDVYKFTTATGKWTLLNK